MKSIEFYYDFGSPTAYLAYTQLEKADENKFNIEGNNHNSDFYFTWKLGINATEIKYDVKICETGFVVYGNGELMPQGYSIMENFFEFLSVNCIRVTSMESQSPSKVKY